MKDQPRWVKVPTGVAGNGWAVGALPLAHVVQHAEPVVDGPREVVHAATARPLGGAGSQIGDQPTVGERWRANPHQHASVWKTLFKIYLFIYLFKIYICIRSQSDNI